MEDNYIGVIVEPWELEDSIRGYSDNAMHHLYNLDRKCLLVEDPSNYGAGEFDLVRYEDFQDYIGERPVFLTGTPESVADVAKDIDQEVVLDQNILERGAINQPSNSQMLKEELFSLIPMYEPDRENVEVTNSEDVLRELGLEGIDTKPAHFL